MITRPITRPVSSPIARAVNNPFGSGNVWSPLALFRGGEQGFWYDPNDLSTLFQDSAGTIPVTAAGQPVGRMLDKSGRGNHVSFGDGASRPMLRQNATTGAYYLETDWADDGGATSAIDFTATDAISFFVGARKLSETTAVLFELSADINTNNGALTVVTGGATERYRAFSKGTAVQSVTVTGAQYNAPHSAVLTVYADISAPDLQIHVNGALSAQSSLSQGTGNYGNRPIYLFRRGGTSLPFTGRCYGLIGVSRLTTAAEAASVEQMLAQRLGVTLA
jgi:hypothetical protein